MSASESSQNRPEATPHRGRRGFFLGAAVAGAAGAVAVALPGTSGVTEPVAEALPTPPEKGGGYALSAHVQHYYRTARV